MQEIIITTHALERWRQRAAVYGDESGTEMIKEVRKSREMPPDDPEYPQRARKDGSIYLKHPELPCVFVAERLHRHTIRIVTILKMDMIVVDRIEEDEIKPYLPPNYQELPKFENVGEMRKWMIEESERLKKTVKQIDDDKLKDQVRTRVQFLQNMLGKIRHQYKCWTVANQVRKRKESPSKMVVVKEMIDGVEKTKVVLE